MTLRGKRGQRLVAQPALAALLSFELLAMTVSSGELRVRSVAGELRVSAPGLHFLAGKSLQRLRDGAAVPFDLQLTLAAGSRDNVIARSLERFTVSYDVWEQKFSVLRLRDFRKSGLHLSANSAESWCLDNIFLPASSLPPGQQLWARLEIRSAEPNPAAALPLPGEGIRLATLVEIFSRPSRPQQEHWALESAAFRLAELKP